MTLSKFVETYKIDKGYDYDGVYECQCVDLIKFYIRDVLGAKPQSIGNAANYWNKRNSPYIKSLFTAVKGKAQKGDVFIRLSGKNGHIGIVTRADDYIFYTIEQNADGNGVVKHMAHTYSDDYKFLRPINQENIMEKFNKPTVKAGKTYTFTTEPYVYKNTKKDAYKICDVTELNSTEKARLKKGTKVKVLEVATISKNVWIKFACYKKSAYALVYNYDKDKAYIK